MKTPPTATHGLPGVRKPSRNRRRLSNVRIGRPTRLVNSVLATVFAVGLTAGCTSAGPVTGTPSPSGSGGSGPSAARSTAPPPTSSGAPAPGVTASPGSELPYDPIPRTLTGSVERSGGCTVLVVGARRWALTGALAGSLTVGSRVTVTGNLIQVPDSCSAEQGPAVQVTRLMP